MKFTFIDDTYTDLCDKFNELDIVNRLNLPITNDRVITLLVECLVDAAGHLKTAQMSLTSQLLDYQPVTGDSAGHIAADIMDSGLRELLIDISQVLTMHPNREFGNIVVGLDPTGYHIELDVL